MNLLSTLYGIDRVNPTRRMTRVMPAIMGLLIIVSAASAQRQGESARISTQTLDPNQIGLVKTAIGISTRVSFPEPVKDVICGDLYDPNSGTGGFVIQRLGKDVFIKPVIKTGVSNMFVTAGDEGEHMYNFSLEVCPIEKAHLVVNVRYAGNDFTLAKNPPKSKAQPVSLPVLPPIDRSADAMSSPPSNEIPDRLPVFEVNQPVPKPEEVRARPLTEEEPRRAALARARIQSQPIKTVDASYPELAREVSATGTVDVEIIVDEKGRVISAKALRGHMLLRQAAVTAARQWRFNPTEIDGVPVQALGVIQFDFKRSAGGGYESIAGPALGNFGRKDRRR